MKKFTSFLFFVSLALLGLAQTMTVHLSGTVKDSLGAAVPNHEVIIHSDSSSGFQFFTTRHTGPNGAYDCTISNVPSSYPVGFFVRTFDCHNNPLTQMFLNTSSPAVINFIICPISPCQAHFAMHADSLHPLQIHFLDVSTPQNQVISRSWNFGDPASGINNHASTYDPWHYYTAPGYYNVCLTIATSTGCTSTFCDSIHVGGTPPPHTCENNFTWTSALLTLTFHGTTSSTYPTVYTWHMGDPAGTTLTGQNVTFTYPATGAYNVTLVTLDSTGCEWTRTKTVYAHATCDVNGHGYMGIHPVDHGWIELIRVDSNNVMTVVQAKEFGDSAGNFHFGGVGPGHYYLKAQLLPSSARYGHFMPTYFEQSLTWQSAQLIILGAPQNPYNIHLVECTPAAPGIGKIQGIISQGGVKLGSGSSGLPDVEVMLLDPNNNPLGYSKTDTAGKFAFENIAFGTYNVKPEKPGAVSSSAQTTVDNNHTVANLPFNFTNGQILYGVNDIISNVSFVGEAFPNPAYGETVKVKINCLKDGIIRLSLFNAIGQIVQRSEKIMEAGMNTLELDVNGLPTGPYYLRISTDEDKTTIRRLTVIGATH